MTTITPLLPPAQTLAVQLAGVPGDGPLADALTTRAPAIGHAHANVAVLFDEVDETRLGKAARLALATEVADWHSDAALAAHYRKQLRAADLTAPTNAAWHALHQHAQTVAQRPVAVAPADHQALAAAGFSVDAIVTASQIVAYVSFQSRLITGLRLLAHSASPTPQPEVAPATAGHWHTQPHTHSGKPAPTTFTRDELGWEPWLVPRSPESLSTVETETLRKAGHLQSDYFMLLARDVPVLYHRTRTDHGIFYSHGGLPRAERELAATVTSKVNGCIYCASVHARKAAQLADAAMVLDTLLAVPPGGDLSVGQSPRWQAQIRFAAQLATTPAALNHSHIAALRAIGLSDLELLDLGSVVTRFSAT